MGECVKLKSLDSISLNLEFACFNISIDHKFIVDLGEFTIFCMKALSEGLTIDDISRITLLSTDLINSQLSFVRQRGYLSKDNRLTEKGNHLINLLEFKRKYSSSVRSYVDCYIDDDKLKMTFSPESIDLLPSEGGIYVKSTINQVRLNRIVNSDSFIDKLLSCLIENIPEHKELIEKEKDNLIFQARYEDSK